MSTFDKKELARLFSPTTKTASVGSAVAKFLPGMTGGVGRSAGLGALLGGLVGAGHRAYKLRQMSRLPTSGLAGIATKGRKALDTFGQSGRKVMSPAEALAKRNREAVISIMDVGKGGKATDWAKALGPDVARSFASGAAAGGALGGAGKAAANVIKRRRTAKAIDKALPWAGAGLGGMYLLGRD